MQPERCTAETPPTVRRPAPRRRGAGLAGRAAALGLALLLAACGNGSGLPELTFSEPRTAIDYEVAVEGAPDEETAALLEQSLALYREQENGAASLAFLRRRAQGDVETVQRILRSHGYYEGKVTVEVTDAVPAPEGSQEAGQPARARLVIDPGRPFTLATHELVLEDTGGTPPPPMEAAALGSPVGGVAAAAGIVGAEGAAVRALRSGGRPYAEFRDRRAVADMEAATLEVTSRISAGPAFVFGPLTIDGAPDVDEDYLRSYVPWEEGQVFDMTMLRDFQQELFATGLFDGAAVQPPATPPEGLSGGPLPVTATLEQAKFRSVALGLRFSTDEGPGVRARFQHRNLFGANERFEALGDASSDIQTLTFTLVKPQFMLRDGQSLTSGLELRHSTEDAFDELGMTLTLGLEREFSDHWTVGAGGLLEASQIDDGETEATAILAGLPIFVAYDSTDNELDASAGQRLRATAIPFAGLFDDEPTSFLRLEARASAYQDLLGDRRLVLAERGRIGSLLAEDADKVPPTRRFYSGGGGSVRGYEKDLIGPLDDRNNPVGGLSVAEIGVELRARVWGDLGIAVFSEAGIVSDDTLPDLSEGLRLAAGFGLRYASPVGPIRLDIAFPIDARKVDDTFQAYIAIGQAF